MGRKAKPTALKELAGNPGKRPLPKYEPRPDSGIPDCPRHLDKVAVAEWKRLGPQLDKLGLLTKIDLAAFTAYCELYSNYIAAAKHIRRKGLVFHVNGQMKKNPAVAMRNDALRLMHKFLSDFGLSPSARAKVSSQMKDTGQMQLPGVDQESRNPNKPEMPTGPLTDDQFFGIEQNVVRH